MTRMDYRNIAYAIRNAPPSVQEEVMHILTQKYPNFNRAKFAAYLDKIGDPA